MSIGFICAIGAMVAGIFSIGFVLGAAFVADQRDRKAKEREELRAAAFAQRMERKGWGDAAPAKRIEHFIKTKGAE